MVTVRDLLYQNPNFKSIVYAGNKGLDKKVRTVSIVDAPDSVSFLTGGELILSTGFLFKDSDMQMYHFIESLINGRAAGLAVQFNIYFHEMPAIVTELANAHNFPIFSIPNDIGWSDIITRFHDLRIGDRYNNSIINVDAVTFSDMVEAGKHNSQKLLEKFVALIGCAAAILSENGEVYVANQAKGWECLNEYIKSMASNTEDIPFLPICQKDYWVIADRLSDGKYIVLMSKNKPVEEDSLQLIQTFYNLINLQDQLEQDRTKQQEQLISAVVNDWKSENIKMLASTLKFYDNQYYCMAVVLGANPAKACRMLSASIENIGGFLESELYHVISNDKKKAIVLLNICAGSMNSLETASCLHRIGMTLTDENLKCRVYWGDVCQSSDELKQSYRQANRAREIALKLSYEAPVVFYSDLDTFDLLYGTKLNFDTIYMLKKAVSKETFDQLETLINSEEGLFTADAQAVLKKMGSMIHRDFSNPVNWLNMMMKLWLLKMPET